MKKLVCVLLCAALMLIGIAAVGAEGQQAASPLILPASIETIDERAFEGDTSVRNVIVPNTVKEIKSRAFANCTALEEITIASRDVVIAPDAFAGCNADAVFNVYAETTADLYALSHGFTCRTLDGANSSLERIMELVATYGGSTSVLQSETFATNRLIVQTSGDRLPDISAYNPLEIVRDSDDIYFIQFGQGDDAKNCYNEFFNDPMIAFIEADACVEVLDEVQASGVTDTRMWSTEDPMGFDTYAPFVAGVTSGKCTIAVIDSGIRKNAAYNDILRSDGVNLVSDGQSWSVDMHLHGSFIAGIIKDCIGTTGVNILPIRVVGDSGTVSLTMVGQAVKYAVSHGASVINMSLNCDQSSYITAQINAALKKGVDVVVAAGNDGKEITKVFPANVPGVVTVSGLDTDYTLTAKSNYGSNVSYTAPGVGIKTSAYAAMLPGTSFAAPQIASALALVSLDPYHSVSDMRTSCMDLGTEGRDSSYGYGMPLLAKLAHVAVAQITIDTPAVLTVGTAVPVSYTVSPGAATDKTVTITSSDEAVLSVVKGDDGVVTLNALNVGTATLTIQANDGSGVSAAKAIDIVQPVTGIQLSGSSHTLYMTRTMDLTAVVSPANASNASITWSTSNSDVAAVDQNGHVTPVGTGSATIRATAQDGYGAIGSWELTVESRPGASTVSVYTSSGDTSAALCPNDTLQLNAVIDPSDALQSVTWSAINGSGEVTVDQAGIVTAVSSGTATVRATAENGVYGDISIMVLYYPQTVVISGFNAVYTNETIQLSARVTPDEVTDNTVTWSSSNTSIATVDSNGLVTGVAPGDVNIIATANGNTSVLASHTVTVSYGRYNIYFELNGGACATTSMIGIVNQPLGTLPTPTRDYYTFEGWFSANDGGYQVTATSYYTSPADVTLYARWRLNAESGWVTEGAVPYGAQITATSWSYRESTETTAASLSGWNANGNYWNQTGSGSMNYATFPSGFKTDHIYYTSFGRAPYTAYNNGSTKREVTNSAAGYVYWHWMYNVQYLSGTNRAISSKTGKFDIYGKNSSSAYSYVYFYAMASTVDCPYLGSAYCCSQSVDSYNCKTLVDSLASAADKSSATSGLGTDRFFRFAYSRSSYTDYQMIYRYYRDLSYQGSDPGSGANITNKVKYVKYRAK